MEYGTGLAGDLVSAKDYSAEAILGSPLGSSQLPRKFDMSDKLGGVKNQGLCGSCTSFGATTAHEIMNNIEHGTDIELDAQYLFDTYQVPNGASCANGDYVLNAVKALVANGSKASDGTVYKADSFVRIYDRRSESLKGYIAQGNPVVIGMNVMVTETTATGGTAWLSVWNKDTGVWERDPVSGGHCMAVTGYDDDLHGGCFIVSQSWGTFGDNGKVYIPYDKMEKFQYNSTYIIYDSKDINMIYKDVAENAWYAESVKWCVDHGVMKLDESGRFNPEMFVPEVAKTINRATIAQIMYNMYKLKPEKFNI